jgi:PIN domain nuclease of toxin-antitoxin system
VIVLDTHVWVWWVQGDVRLAPGILQALQDEEPRGLGVSVFSCWEVAKLVQLARLALPCPVLEWFEQALAYPGVQLLELTPRIAFESTRLPGEFHRDPADQILVATARVLDCPLATADERILRYRHVRTIASGT